MRGSRAYTAGSADGFTIIEVLFFLAISGALIVALLTTVGVTISRQRFSDSVNGAQAFVQSQYNETLNVVNNREPASCGTGGNGATSPGTGAATTNRGASNCVVLGKAIDFTIGSSVVTAYPVVGREPAADPDATGAELLAKYAPGIDTNNPETYEVSWGASVIGVRQQNTNRTITRILLLRSPDSGLVLAYGGDRSASPASALGVTAGTYDVCIQSADLTNAVSMVALSPIAGAEGVTTKFDLNNAEQGSLC